MYRVDDQDTVIELSDAPRPNVGAPLPIILADEHRLLLAYLVSEADPDWDGSNVTVVTPESDGLVAIVRFDSPTVHMFGPPNDEAFGGHPLSERGLCPNAVHEVRRSSWIRDLERMNSVHPYHNRQRFLEHKRHFIFAFHDSTFESVAHGFDATLVRGSLASALSEMMQLFRVEPR